tara:strand:+ start:26629 stop:27555 length:927 start_codon:yes stop_codon:yes gene_type:complete
MNELPAPIRDDLSKARRLEYWTLGWQASIVVVMFLAMGSSQAMKSAWVEDMLGLVPASVFLLALHYERKPPTEKFPFGFSRVNSLAFLVAAAALVFMALYLIYDAGMKLIHMEHPTIGAAPFFGPDVWMGWVMIAALLYSVVPPLILGRIKEPIAKRLQDKVLHTDALMQKADWMTGVAGAFGVLGVGMGWWWADSVAALIIAVDILKDGKNAFVIATAELADGTPRKLDSDDIAEDVNKLRSSLHRQFGDSAELRFRESGRYIFVEVTTDKIDPVDLDSLWPEDDERDWRLANVSATLDRRRPTDDA